MTKEDVAHILNVLRQGTITWKGRRDCLQKARIAVAIRTGKKGQTIYKYHWQCKECRRWTDDEKAMQVDHVIEIGGFKGDWHSVVTRMYDAENLQALCIVCHAKKTSGYNATRLFVRKKP